MYKFGAKKFPAIAILKTGMPRPEIYPGQINYQSIFDWLNIYSEQFVPGGGNSADGPGDKPWLNDAVPELFSKSAEDVCLQGDKALCVILFNNGKPNDQVLGVMKDIRRAYDNKTDRSVSFKFMWINAQTQSEWTKMFEVTSSPSVVVLNTGRRKRYLLNAGTPTFASLNSLLEKIIGGDSKFNPCRPNDLPKLI